MESPAARIAYQAIDIQDQTSTLVFILLVNLLLNIQVHQELVKK